MVIPSEKAHLVVGVRQGGRDEVRGLDDGIAPEVGVHDPRAIADGPEPAYGDEDILAPPYARRPHHRVAGQPRPIIDEPIPDATSLAVVGVEAIVAELPQAAQVWIEASRPRRLRGRRLEDGEDRRPPVLGAPAGRAARMSVRTDPVLMHHGGVALDARSVGDLLRGKGDAQGAASVIRPYRGGIDQGQPVTTIRHDVAHGPSPVVDLKIDPRTRDAIRDKTVAHNEVVTRDVTPDPTVQALVSKAVTEAAPIANKAVGTITSDIVATEQPSGESVKTLHAGWPDF